MRAGWACALAAASAMPAALAAWGCSKATCSETLTCDAGPAANDASTRDGPGFFCDTQIDAFKCESFDKLGNLTALHPAQQGGATVTLAAEDAAPSPPNTLQIGLPAVSGSAAAASGFYEFDAGSPTSLHFSFMMRLDTADAGGVVVISIGRGAGYQLFLDIHPDPASASLELTEQFGSPVVGHVYTGRLPDFTQWNLYDVNISFANGGSFTLDVDDAGATAGGLDAGSAGATLVFRVLAGVFNPSSPTGPQLVHIDNVVVYETP